LKKIKESLLWVPCIALLVRGIYFLEIKNQPFFSLAIGDGESYDRWAQQLSSGNWLGGEVFSQSPLYPYALGVLYSLFGRDIIIVKLIQLIMGALSCYLLAHAGRLFFDRRIGLISGLLLAIYPTAVFFEGVIQKTPLALLILCFFLFMLAHSIQGNLKSWIVAGLALGLLALVRENLLIMVPVVALWILLDSTQPFRHRVRPLGLFFVGIALVLLPVRVWDGLRAGDFKATSVQLGSNFYIGNNPRATGSYVALKGNRSNWKQEWSDAVELAEKDVGRSLTAYEVSNYWLEKAFNYISNHPFAWLRLLTKKWFLTWSSHELTDTESEADYAEHSTILSILRTFLNFGTLFPLALLGMIISRHARGSRLLSASFFALTFGVALFYVVSRYRFPLVPLGILFASVALVWITSQIRHAEWRLLRAPSLLLLFGGLISWWPIQMPFGTRGTTYLNFAFEYHESGDFENALPNYLNVFRFFYPQPDNRKDFMRLVTTQAEHSYVRSSFLQFLKKYPDRYPLQQLYGELLAKWGDKRQAIHHLSRAIQIEPSKPRGYLSLAGIFLKNQEIEKARAQIEAGLRENPDSQSLHFLHGRIFVKQGNFALALDQFRQAEIIDPDYAPLQFELGKAHLTLGKRQEALKAFQNPIVLAPSWSAPLLALKQLEIKSLKNE